MKCTCGHPDNYNYAINNGLCNSCIAEKLEQLDTTKANVESLLKTIQTWKEWSKLVTQELDTLKAKLDRASTGEKHDGRDWGDE